MNTLLEANSRKQAVGYLTFDFVDDLMVYTHKKPNVVTRFVLKHFFQTRWHPIDSAI
jgi:hypothetical protein